MWNRNRREVTVADRITFPKSDLEFNGGAWEMLPAKQSFNHVVLFQKGTNTESPISPGAKPVRSFFSVSSSTWKSVRNTRMSEDSVSSYFCSTTRPWNVFRKKNGILCAAFSLFTCNISHPTFLRGFILKGLEVQLDWQNSSTVQPGIFCSKLSNKSWNCPMLTLENEKMEKDGTYCSSKSCWWGRRKIAWAEMPGHDWSIFF